MAKRKLELLAPAANAQIAIQAVLHGADAVYMGATSHGARKSASNSIESIAEVVEFAHQYRVKVYVTVNTIVYENELKKVYQLCESLYRIGVDAIIVQDMALLDLNLPPIALHASTQCDIRTPEKARFLQDVGFSQLVLARELTLEEIRKITETVSVPVECFVHGALCVSYSGRCHASFVTLGRSANRGECAQICRMPFTLTDSRGRVLAKDKHLLSLRDFNASDKIGALIEAGVSSFKIEGRLKDMDYVKNIVAYYRAKIDEIIASNPDKYERSSFGKSSVSFKPQPCKSFNRGFTDYFLPSWKSVNIASFLTPKSMGEIISDIRLLHNGDGISFFDKNGLYQGVHINRVEGNKIIPGRKIDIPKGTVIHRTNDIEWQKMMSRPTADRKLALNVTLDNNGVTGEDERGVKVRILLDVTKEIGRKEIDYKSEFEKLGNTPYFLNSYYASHDRDMFIPRSEINELRRRLIRYLDQANLLTYPYDKRREEKEFTIYPSKELDFRDNVANSVAEKFYLRHGVEKIEKTIETKTTTPEKDIVVMTTRYCILRELGMCKKNVRPTFQEPLKLIGGSKEFRLRFNCSNCEMEVLLDSKCNNS
ncbi:MAG: U32 family peptidase [Bacteroides sp.]|nr:U32 family peptidase [Bacteroides sp.]